MMARVPSSGPIDDKVGPEHDRVAQTAEQTPLKRSVVGSRPIAIPWKSCSSTGRVVDAQDAWFESRHGFLDPRCADMGLLLTVLGESRKPEST
jgi:hypothetical protein